MESHSNQPAPARLSAHPEALALVPKSLGASCSHSCHRKTYLCVVSNLILMQNENYRFVENRWAHLGNSEMTVRKEIAFEFGVEKTNARYWGEILQNTEKTVWSHELEVGNDASCVDGAGTLVSPAASQ